jgi:uncharacterized membrane protein
MSTQRWALLVLVFVIGLGLRIYHLDRENFWIDEVVYLQDASQSPGDIINYSTAVRTRVHHVSSLPHLVAHFVVSPENTERSARLPSAIFGSLETLLIFMIGHQVFSFQFGLLAAFFLALSPLHLWYSQEARWYAQWSFMTTCTYLALVHAWKSNRTASWIGYGLTTLLNLYTFIYSCFVIVLQTVGMWWSARMRQDRRGFLVKFVGAHLLVVIGALPMLLMILRGLQKSTGTPRPVGVGDLPYTFFAYAGGFTTGPTLAELHALPGMFEVIHDYPTVLAYFAVFFPAIILGLRRVIRNPLASSLLLPWLFGLPLLVFLIATLTNITYEVRYTLPSLGAFVLVLACGVLSLRSKTGQVAFASLIAFCSVFSITNFYWNVRYDKEHVRAAVARIKTVEGDKTPVVSIGQIGSAAKYYGNGLEIIPLQEDRCETAGAEDLPREGSLRGSNTIWVIAGRDWDDRATACLNKLKQTFSVVDHERFIGTDVWRLRRRPLP